MKLLRIGQLFAVVSLLLVHGLVLALDTGEEQKIDALIQIVRSMHDEKFIRNGKEYDTVKAVKLITYKYKKEKLSLTNATEFIEKCAAKSGTTGLPYQIKFPDGTIKTSEAFLKEKLADIEKDGAQP